MTDPHMLKSFDDALSELSKGFDRMGTLVGDNCDMAARAYLQGDARLALEVVNRDLDIDAAFEAIRADCFDILLRFQPVAGDLRLVVGIEHAVGDLERAGDHAKNMARRVISSPSKSLSEQGALRFAELTDTVVQSLRLAVGAMVHRDSEDAKRVIALDSQIDARNDAIFDSVMVDLKKSAKNAPRLVQQLFISKALERIGDHATNLAEEVLFLTRGVPPGATRTGRN